MNRNRLENRKDKAMGRGTSKAGRTTVPQERRNIITRGLETHTKEQNDRAEARYNADIAKEQEVVNNFNKYKLAGAVKSRNDEWFQGHVESLNALKAQLEFFKKERKRLNR